MYKTTDERLYRLGVFWLAENNDPGIMDLQTISEDISTCLLADMFHKKSVDVAKDIKEARRI